MKKWWRKGALAASMLVLMSCGGGGGGSAPAPTPVTALPSQYLGTFAGTCEPAEDITVASNGNPVSVRSFVRVQNATGNTAQISVRFDFHLDGLCADHPVAHLAFDAAYNRVTFEGTQAASGRTAHRVRITLGPPAGVTVSGAQVLFGDAIPLSAPAGYFAGASFADLWLL